MLRYSCNGNAANQNSHLYSAHLQFLLQQQTYHKGIILLCTNTMTKYKWSSLADFGLDSAGDTRVADTEQATGWGAWCKPVATSQSFHQGLKVHLQVYRRVLLRDLTQWLHSFVTYHCLLNSGQALQWWLGKASDIQNYAGKLIILRLHCSCLPILQYQCKTDIIVAY